MKLATLGLMVLTLLVAVPYNQDVVVPPTEAVIEDAYKIKVEFVVFANEVKLYPDAVIGFMRAVREWSSLIPIEVTVFMEPAGFVSTFFNMSSPASYPSIIHIHFTDMSLAPWMDKEYIGVWVPSDWTVTIDGEFLKGKADLARIVAIHELGHVFGVSHVVTQGSLMGRTGDMTIPSALNPDTYIMFPTASKKNKDSELSQIVIDRARKYMLGGFWNATMQHCVGECGYVHDHSE